jgi:hypothetical protein
MSTPAYRFPSGKELSRMPYLASPVMRFNLPCAFGKHAQACIRRPLRGFSQVPLGNSRASSPQV